MEEFNYVPRISIRLGSTNRRADPEMIAEIRLLSRNTFFDEQPRTEISSEEVDFRAASELFAAVSRPLNSPTDRVLAEMGTGPKDPYRTYILKEGYPE